MFVSLFYCKPFSKVKSFRSITTSGKLELEVRCFVQTLLPSNSYNPSQDLGEDKRQGTNGLTRWRMCLPCLYPAVSPCMPSTCQKSPSEVRVVMLCQVVLGTCIIVCVCVCVCEGHSEGYAWSCEEQSLTAKVHRCCMLAE